MVEQFITSSLALLMMGLCLHVSLRLLYGARGPAPDDSVYFFMKILSWGLLLIPAAILFVAGANWLSVLLFVALAHAGFELILGRRAIQRQTAWRILSSSLGGDRSAIESLQFHQARFSGIVGRWYRSLLADLERGVGWQQALWHNRRALPREAPAVAGMLDFAAGQNLAAYELDDSSDPTFQTARQQIAQRFVYLATLIFMMMGVITYLMISIIPSYQAIFSDFDLSLPPITQSLIASSDWFSGELGAVFIALAAACVLGALIAGVCYLCDFAVLQPVADLLMMSRHRAWVLRLLAAAFARGKTVDAALGQLTSGWSAYPSPIVRRTLEAVHRRVLAGQPWLEALEQTRLISPGDVAVLSAAEGVGNLPWAMRMLADRKLRLTAFRWTMAQQVMFTVIILALSLFVLWVGVAMLFPLAQLILSLTP